MPGLLPLLLCTTTLCALRLNPEERKIAPPSPPAACVETFAADTTPVDRAPKVESVTEPPTPAAAVASAFTLPTVALLLTSSRLTTRTVPPLIPDTSMLERATDSSPLAVTAAPRVP